MGGLAGTPFGEGSSELLRFFHDVCSYNLATRQKRNTLVR
jgi:hypothetical protein